MSLVNRPITDAPVHIIYRLVKSLPAQILSRLRKEYRQFSKELTTDLRRIHSKDSARKEIVRQAYRGKLQDIQQRYDYYLDQVLSGPAYLNTPEIAQLIIASWQDLEKMHALVVDAISVMPNHVHIQLSTNHHEVVVDSKGLLASHRQWTSRLINKIRNTKGEKVWATPFFDRDVRWDAFGTVFWYILENPVKAGLCKDFRSWPGNYWRSELMD